MLIRVAARSQPGLNLDCWIVGSQPKLGRKPLTTGRINASLLLILDSTWKCNEVLK